MADTYRTRLKAMCDNDMLYRAILKLNYDFLELARTNIYESGVALSPTAALAKVERELGPEEQDEDKSD